MNDVRYLFRGKRLDNNEIIYGFYIEVKHHDDDSHVHYFIIPIELCVDDFNGDHLLVEVDPSTIGQYTGLKDKNGKRIFEGDILEFTNSDGEKSYYSVVWHDVGWCIRYGEICTEEMTDWHPEEWEIVGNIHDNLELLEG